MLKIRFTDDRSPAFWAMDKTFSIGRASSNHLSIDDDSIDEHHAKILHKGDTFQLKDSGSRAGTFVNGTRVSQKNIGCGDEITLGDVTLEIVDPFANAHHDKSNMWTLIADASWLTGQEFPLNIDTSLSSQQKPILLGRSSECDVVIPGTHLSRKHAEITFTGKALTIRDLGSANGTYVNNKKIESASLKPGDQLRLDVYSFKVFGPGIQLPRAATLTQKAVTEDMLREQNNHAQGATEEKLWKTKATSPGNRTQENLYKRNWLPAIVAIGLIVSFLGGVLWYFVYS